MHCSVDLYENVIECPHCVAVTRDYIKYFMFLDKTKSNINEMS